MQPDYLPQDLRNNSDFPDVMSFDVVDTNTAVNPGGTEVIGTDEVFLIPDVDLWMDEYLDLREMGSPEVYGPVQQRGGKRAFDYKARYGMKWDPFGNHPNATDVVHIKNVSELFGPNN